MRKKEMDMPNKEKVVGVLGGMGPEATADLMVRVIKATPAGDDVDHVRMVVDNNPKVPSRIKAIIEKTGESPGPCMAEMGRKLAGWGVDFLVIPCNTAHYYYEDVRSAVDIPVLNMIDLAVERIIAENPGIKAVGLMASTAVLMIDLYKERFNARGVELINPETGPQELLMDAIRKIKTGSYDESVTEVLSDTAAHLAGNGAEALLVACTELSVISGCLGDRYKLYDSSQILAENIVKNAKGIG